MQFDGLDLESVVSGRVERRPDTTNRLVGGFNRVLVLSCRVTTAVSHSLDLFHNLTRRQVSHTDGLGLAADILALDYWVT